MDPANLGGQGTEVLGLHDHFLRAINFMAPYPFFYLFPTRRISRHLLDLQHTDITVFTLRGVPKILRGRDRFLHQLLSLGLWVCYKGTQTVVYSWLEPHLPKVVASTLTTIACAPIRLSWTYLVTSDENERDGASMTSLFTIRRSTWQRFIATTILCDNFDLVTGLCLKSLFDAIAPFPSDEEILSGEATIPVSSSLTTAALILPTVMLLWIPETLISTYAATAALYQQSEVDKGWLYGVAEDIRTGIHPMSLQLCRGLSQDYLLGSVSVLGIALAPTAGWVLFRRHAWERDLM